MSERLGRRGINSAWVLLGALICLAGLGLLIATMQKAGNHPLYDFRGGLFNAGLAILHGHSPYHSAFLSHQAEIMRTGAIARGETDVTAFSIPVYPAAANLAVIPLSLLPYWLAGLLYTAGSIAAMLVGIWLLGVRDRRCLLLVLVSWPFLDGLYLGAIGPFLVLGTGIAWRWRGRLWPPALAIASIVAVKVFPWPLAVWLLITRRFNALPLTVVVGLAVTLGAWAAIGFDGLAQYPQMLSNLSFLQAGRAVSVVSVLLVAGAAPAVAGATALALAGALLAVAWWIARRPGGEGTTFGLVILAALTGTPIVWEHYMVLLFVPVALASPRLSKTWLLPLCPPLIVVASSALIPVSHRLAAAPPETLRRALPWLLVQGLVGAQLLAGHGLRLPHPHLRLRARVARAAGSADLA